MLKKTILKSNKIKFDPFSCLLLSSCLFPKNLSLKFYHNNIFIMGLCFLLLEHLFCLSHCKLVVGLCVGLKNVFWGPWTPWSLWHFQSVNQRGWLHGPWCKQSKNGVTRGACPKYDMDAYMVYYSEERFETCVESWVEQKASSNS